MRFAGHISYRYLEDVYVLMKYNERSVFFNDGNILFAALLIPSDQKLSCRSNFIAWTRKRTGCTRPKKETMLKVLAFRKYILRTILFNH